VGTTEVCAGRAARALVRALRCDGNDGGNGGGAAAGAAFVAAAAASASAAAAAAAAAAAVPTPLWGRDGAAGVWTSCA